MTYRNNITYRGNVLRYVDTWGKIHPVSPAQPALPGEKFIINYSGESMREAYEFCMKKFRERGTIYWLRAAQRIRNRWANKIYYTV